MKRTEPFPIGTKKDYLTITEVIGWSRSNRWRYRCQCECGKPCERNHNSLIDKSRISSCGCAHPAKTKINEGDKIGSLIILKETEPKFRPSGIKVRRLECQCDICGEIDIYDMPRLNGETKCYKCSQRNVIEHPILDGEMWLPAKDWEGYIEISNMGRIRSIDRIVNMSNGGKRMCKGQPLNPHYDKDGYLRVSLKYENRTKHKQVHRLVAETFIPNPDNKPEVDHINGKRDDNRVENLRWCTNYENIMFPLAHENRRQATIQSYNKKPELRKLRAETLGRSGLKPIEVFYKGESIGKFKCQTDFAREYGLTQSLVSDMYRKGIERKGYRVIPC